MKGSPLLLGGNYGIFSMFYIGYMGRVCNCVFNVACKSNDYIEGVNKDEEE